MAWDAFMTARAELRRTDGFVLARRIAAGIIDMFLLSQLQMWIDQLFGVVPGPNSMSYGLYGGGMVMGWSGAAVDVSWLVLIVVLYFFVRAVGKWQMWRYLRDDDKGAFAA
ncbi:hypothetical protein [Dictyobacter arantiisoli]|uniref:Uncharacterized protein n=1 Tax=Dictyobacter arantiisoli TaxID=2014874 RepID=A0A5A5TIE2_9CHLR|nr:hypothetical protein [Dictyobacter arantiisoli]GCF10823.1 hypothetical protein KDI_43870 [Dictyobacter arantiisoli]